MNNYVRQAAAAIGRRVDYPHALEHEGHLLVAFSGGKQSVEVLKIRLADVDRIAN